MPESAIASGYIDFILSPEEIAFEIKRIVNADSGYDQNGTTNKNYSRSVFNSKVVKSDVQ